MPYTSHSGGFSPRASAPAPVTVVDQIETTFDYDTAYIEKITAERQADLFRTRSDHLAATFRPTTLTVRVTPAVLGQTIAFTPMANVVGVQALIENAVQSIGQAAMEQARRQFATQLADHLAGIRS